jgi:membrane-associated phospholipid phosphatase
VRPDSQYFWQTSAAVTCGVAIVVVFFFHRIDIAIAEWLGRFRDADWVAVLRTVTRIGESHWVLVPAFVLFVYWRKRRPERARGALFVFVSVGAVGLAVLGAKIFAGRCRPHLWRESAEYGFRWFEVSPAFHSFPSGHAATLFAAAAALGLLWPGKRWAFLLIALALAVSRLFVGRHYVSDVIAGAWFGFVGVYMLARFAPRLAYAVPAAEQPHD